VTFIQRFGSAINLHLHFHCVFLEGVYLDRTEAGRKPQFVHCEPPSDTDIATVVQKISRRIIRKLRQLGYLEAGLGATVATDYDPLRDDAPELARTMAAMVGVWPRTATCAEQSSPRRANKGWTRRRRTLGRLAGAGHGR
jgi:hypothetical protein